MATEQPSARRASSGPVEAGANLLRRTSEVFTAGAGGLHHASTMPGDNSANFQPGEARPSLLRQQSSSQMRASPETDVVNQRARENLQENIVGNVAWLVCLSSVLFIFLFAMICVTWSAIWGELFNFTKPCDVSLAYYLPAILLWSRIPQWAETVLESRECPIPVRICVNFCCQCVSWFILYWGYGMVHDSKTCPKTNPGLFYPVRTFIYFQIFSSGFIAVFMVVLMFGARQILLLAEQFSGDGQGCAQAVKELPKVAAGAAELIEESGEVLACPICMEPLEGAVRTKCDHFFHEECLERWCTNHMDCPLCRQPVGEPDSARADDAPDLESGVPGPSAPPGRQAAAPLLSDAAQQGQRTRLLRTPPQSPPDAAQRVAGATPASAFPQLARPVSGPPARSATGGIPEKSQNPDARVVSAQRTESAPAPKNSTAPAAPASKAAPASVPKAAATAAPPVDFLMPCDLPKEVSAAVSSPDASSPGKIHELREIGNAGKLLLAYDATGIDAAGKMKLGYDTPKVEGIAAAMMEKQTECYGRGSNGQLHLAYTGSNLKLSYGIAKVNTSSSPDFGEHRQPQEIRKVEESGVGSIPVSVAVSSPDASSPSKINELRERGNAGKLLLAYDDAAGKMKLGYDTQKVEGIAAGTMDKQEECHERGSNGQLHLSYTGSNLKLSYEIVREQP